MKKTMLVMSSNRELEAETRRTVDRLRKEGACLLMQHGSADVAYARCQALSSACDQLRNGYSDRDVILMLDDDMEVTLEAAQTVVGAARQSGQPCSAVYATRDAHVAGCRWQANRERWLVGLGCLAIPAGLLLELEAKSESFTVRKAAKVTAFTWSGPENGQWIAEDYRLSMRLGGVRLLPLAVGHVKKGTLYPDDETIRLIAEGKPLDGNEEGGETDRS